MKHALRMVICLLLVITFRPLSVFGATHSFTGTVGEVINYVNPVSGSNMQTTFGLTWLSEGTYLTVSLDVPDNLLYLYDGWWSHSGGPDWIISDGTDLLRSSDPFFENHPYFMGQALVWDDRVEDENIIDRYTVNDMSKLILLGYSDSISMFEVSMWNKDGTYYNFDRTASSIPFDAPDPASLTPGADGIRNYCQYHPEACSSNNIYDAVLDLKQVITNVDGSTSYGSVFLVSINFDNGPPVATPEPATMLLLGLGLIGLLGARRKLKN